MDFLVPAEIETNRLLLRQFRDTDWPDLHEYYADPIATRYTFGRLLNAGDTWRIMCGMIGHWQLRGYGPYAVVHQKRDKVLGLVGLWYPNDWPEPEIKWGLAAHAWGQGFASEAARAVQQIAKRHMPELSLISMIHPENRPSVRLALAVGAKFEREYIYQDVGLHIYRHSAG